MTGPMNSCVAGIDVGSTLTKVVVRDGAKVGSAIGRTGGDYVASSARLLLQALESLGLDRDQLAYVVATGYGRRGLPFADRQLTEIACHARGVTALFPAARTIIDIGGQDAKGIKVNSRGTVLKFSMNDKCAAGTGRFIEVVASTLGLTLDELHAQSLGATSAATLSNMCTLFAEQELTQLLADGTPLPDVIAGLHQALASRVYRMVRGLGIESEIIFTGGCARNRALVRALESCLGQPLLMPADPELTGALGAALVAADCMVASAPTDAARRLKEYVEEHPEARQGTRGVFLAPGKAREVIIQGRFSVRTSAPLLSPRAGLDAGALFIKAVVVHDGFVSYSVRRGSGKDYAAAAEAALAQALEGADVTEAALESIAVTGRGAPRLRFEHRLDELSCLASGMHAVFPDVEQAIDIGGHGSRVVSIDAAGRLRDFVAPGQCAAGGARVLETMAHLLGLELDDLGQISLRSTSPATYSTGCPVFAESAAITLMTRGTSTEDLLAGLHEALAARVMSLARTNLRNGVRALAGGGAKDRGLVERLRGHCPQLLVPSEPMVIPALGAALRTAQPASGPSKASGCCIANRLVGICMRR